MRWITLLLLVMNAALFGYFKLNESRPVGVTAGHEAIKPDMIKVLTAEALAAMPLKAESAPSAPTPPPEPTACYEWGSFSAENIASAKATLERLTIDASLQRAVSQEAKRYWVYVPPRKTAEEAQAKSEEIKALGIEEIFVVQEPKWRNAISLGVFKDEALATKLLEDLRAKGVKSAVKGVRNHESDQSNFLLKHVSESAAAEIGKLRPDFPGSEIRKVACP